MLRCKMCEMWKSGKDVKELDIEEWKQAFIKLKGILHSETEICFTGGEPLLKKEILELVRFVADNGFRTGLNTNAYLINENTAKSIAESRLWSITISLESLDEGRHDFIRGVPGGYRRVMKAIEILSNCCNGLYIGVSTVIMENNLEDILDLARWVQNSERLSSIRFQAMMQPLGAPDDKNWHKNNRYNALWPKDVSKACSILDKMIAQKDSGKLEKLNNPSAQLRVFKDYFKNPSALPRVKKCIYHDSVFNINPSGDAFLCPEERSLGNVKTDNIIDMWQSEAANKVRESIRNCTGTCKFSVNCFWE